jgi:hypothetical protein
MRILVRPLVVALALAVASCTTVDVPSPATLAPSATAALTPSATPGPTERELSDRFWGRVITYAPMAFGFHTLEEIVAGSDLIVRGRIAGRTTASCPAEPSPAPARPDICEGGLHSFAIVAVDAVLKSDSRHASGTVLLKLELRHTTEADTPRGELVLFLKNDGQFYADLGYPTPSDSPRWQWYFLANSYQGALRNLDGVVDVPVAPERWWDDYGPFPSDVDRQPFDQVVARIADLVGR